MQGIKPSHCSLRLTHCASTMGTPCRAPHEGHPAMKGTPFNARHEHEGTPFSARHEGPVPAKGGRAPNLGCLHVLGSEFDGLRIRSASGVHQECVSGVALGLERPASLMVCTPSACSNVRRAGSDCGLCERLCWRSAMHVCSMSFRVE